MNRKKQEDIEIVTALLKEVHLALEELQRANEDLQQHNEELSNTQQSLVAERQRYQELFEEVPDAYFVTDTKGLIQEANSAATTLLNISKSGLLGKLLEIYVLEKEIIAFHLKLTHLRDHAEIPDWKMQEWEVNLRPHNRTPIIAAVKVVAIRNQQGKLVGLRWILRDISENKRTQSKLQWAEQAMRQALAKEREFSELKSRLLTITSHEFRTPLATIHSCAELLEYYRHLWSDERQNTHLRRIQKSVMHMTQLLNDVLMQELPLQSFCHFRQICIYSGLHQEFCCALILNSKRRTIVNHFYLSN